jgi:hypothetical protein
VFTLLFAAHATTRSPREASWRTSEAVLRPRGRLATV